MNRKMFISIFSIFAIILTFAGSISYAYLHAQSAPVSNKFNKASVKCELTVDDGTDGSISSIRVTNTGNAFCFVRVTLRTNWVNDNGDVTMESSAVLNPSYNSDKWLDDGNNVFYYRYPLEPDTSVELLKSPIELKTDTEKGIRQVVMATAGVVQATPEAAQDIWPVTVDATNSITSVLPFTMSTTQKGENQ
jgi:hypothetical protein